MLHKRIYIVSGNELESLIEDADKPASVNSSSCKEKVLHIVEPLLTPLAQAIASYETRIKALETEISDLKSNMPDAPEVLEFDSESAFLLRFPTKSDFEKAEPCLRSLSDLLETNNVNFEIIEL